MTVVAEDPALKITFASGTIHLQDGMSVDPQKFIFNYLILEKRLQKRNILC